jgi:hypothetical protein
VTELRSVGTVEPISGQDRDALDGAGARHVAALFRASSPLTLARAKTGAFAYL